jgi:Ni/Fe-hydrogenase subunit HybB-like protein
MTAHDPTHGAGVLGELAGRLPVKPNARKRTIWIVLMAVGLAAFAFLLFTEPKRAWGAWTVNTLFFLGIAMGGIVLSAAIRLCNGRWGGPIQRVGESLSAYLPAGIVTMVILLAFGIWQVLPWTKDVLPRQAPYLNVPFLWIRTLGGLALFWWLARKYVAVSLRPDAQLLLGHVAPELKGDYDKVGGNWRGEEAEEASRRHELAHLSPQLVLTFVAFMSVMSWDFVMSITPNWVSGLFGWYFYAAAFNTGVCMTAFLAGQLRTKYRLEPWIESRHFWDTGKVIFSFCIFWVYTFWSQYLPIWYANMPEETWWVFLRFEEPWRTLSMTVFTMIFLIPFFGLMNKATKANPTWLGLFALIVMAGVWLERHLLVMPSLEPRHVWVGLPEFGVMLLFLGVFGWTVQGFLTRWPAVSVVDAVHPPGGHGH